MLFFRAHLLSHWFTGKGRDEALARELPSQASLCQHALSRAPDRNRKILVLIPARNEAERIPHVIHSIRRNLSECDILVIEDSSVDNTVEVVRSLGVKIVSLPTNLGYGGAIRVGFQYALAKGYDYVVTMDADGQHDAADLSAILASVTLEGNDLVVGSRFRGGITYSIPMARRIGMLLFSAITSMVVGKRLPIPLADSSALARELSP